MWAFESRVLFAAWVAGAAAMLATIVVPTTTATWWLFVVGFVTSIAACAADPGVGVGG